MLPATRAASKATMLTGHGARRLPTSVCRAAAGRRELGPPLSRRTRRRLPLPRAGRRREEAGTEAAVREARGSRGSPQSSAGKSCSATSGRPLPAYTTARRTRLLAWAARHFGTVARAADDAGRGRPRGPGATSGWRATPTNRQMHQAAVDIASDSAVHARELSEVDGTRGGAVARRRHRAGTCAASCTASTTG